MTPVVLFISQIYCTCYNIYNSKVTTILNTTITVKPTQLLCVAHRIEMSYKLLLHTKVTHISCNAILQSVIKLFDH